MRCKPAADRGSPPVIDTSTVLATPEQPGAGAEDLEPGHGHKVTRVVRPAPEAPAAPAPLPAATPGLPDRLIAAVHRGDLAAVAAMMQDPACIAQINTEDAGGWTPVDHAIERQCFQLARLLIEHGAQPADTHTASERLMADLIGYGQLPLAKLFARHRLNLWHAGYPLQLEASAEGIIPLHEAIRAADAELVGLLALPQSLSLRDAYGRTAFHLALECGDIAKLHRLLAVLAASPEDRVVLDAQRLDGCTVVMQAVRAAADDALAALLRAGASTGLRDHHGNAALHHAAAAGNRTALLLLLSAGARLDATNRAGQTPRAMALACGKAEAAGLLAGFGSRN